MNAVLASLLIAGLWIGPILAMVGIVFLARRWFHSKNRRNPLTSGLLRGPAHTLREQLEDIRFDMMAHLSVGATVPLAAAAIYMAQRLADESRQPITWLYVSFGLGGFVFGAYKLVGLVKKARNLRLGLEAETAVGEELNLLMKDGFNVFHDVPGDKDFNVDHVVVGPTGVFAVETKGRAKPARKGDSSAYSMELREGALRFPGWTETEPLAQARRNAEWVAKWLTSAVGERVNVKPALVLPGWYVELKDKCDVAVLSGKQCRGYFPKARATPLTPKLIRQISHQLDARCRDVEATSYKPLKE